MNKFVICTVVLFSSLIVNESSAVTYYVATNGSDNNDGVISSPFKRIQKAAEVVNPGDTVIVKDGVYTDTDNNGRIVLLEKGGTSDNWITFRSENKWGAVLDGENNSISYCWMVGDNINYIRIEDFEVKGCGSAGFWSSSNTQYIYYYCNHVHDIGRLCTDDVYGRMAFYQRSSAHHITYDSNVIHHIGRYATGENNCQNETHNYQNHDHGMYLNGSNATIINNIFFENKSGWDITVTGCYRTNGITDWNIINNTFVGENPYRAGHIALECKNTNINIQNNIFHNPKDYAISVYGAYDGSNKSNITIKNNLVYDAKIIVPIAEQYQNNYTIENNIEK